VKNIGDGNVNRLAGGSNRGWATRGSKRAGLNFIFLFRVLWRRRAAGSESPGDWRVAGWAVGGANWRRAGQPATDCLCF
jgi:hypothetical protein